MLTIMLLLYNNNIIHVYYCKHKRSLGLPHTIFIELEVLIFNHYAIYCGIQYSVLHLSPEGGAGDETTCIHNSLASQPLHKERKGLVN